MILYLVLLLASILAYDYIYPRFIYDWKAKRANCARVQKSLGWPFGLLKTAALIKLSRSNQVLAQYVPPQSQVTRLVQINTFLIIETAEPENIKALLSTQFNDFDLGPRHSILSPLLGNGIFTVHGAEWKHQRTLLRPIFARDRVSKLAMLDRHTSSLLRCIDRSGFVDVQRIFFDFTMDTSLHFLFDIEHDSFGDDAMLRTKTTHLPAVDLFNALQRISKFLIVRKLLARVSGLAYTSQFRKDLATVHSFADAIVDEVLANDASQESFISQAARVNPDPKFLRDQAFTMFVAGRSTTASFLTHLILELSQTPDKWERLRENVLAELGTDTSKITFESLKRCSYLSACLNETLRLHPNVALNVRTAVRDTTLPRGGGPDRSGKVFVPKGTSVQYNSYGVQRDPRYWGEDANEFRPERWADLKLHPWTYIPFNGGPRTCLGQQFALNEVGFVLARLAQEYVAIVPGQCVKEKKYQFSLSVTIRVEPGVEVSFQRQPS